MIFTEPEAWTGGDFELLIFLGKKNSQEIRRALSILWSFQSLEGCWLDSTVEPEMQAKVNCEKWNSESENTLRGLATLSNRKKCACSSYVVIDEDGAWIYFGMPLGSLGKAYDIGAFPFEDGTDHSWIQPVSEWLAQLGMYVFEQVQFSAGITGFITTIEVEEVLEILQGPIPDQRWNGYLRNENGELVWYPPNTPSAPATVDG